MFIRLFLARVLPQNDVVEPVAGPSTSIQGAASKNYYFNLSQKSILVI